MKRFLYILLVLPLLALVASCSDDDKDLPKVSISVDYSGAVEEDGVLVITQGQPFKIDALKVTSLDGKKATLGNTTYYMDGEPFYAIGVPPFGCEIDTNTLPVGEHVLSFYTQVFQVDKETGFALYGLKLKVVAAEDTPGDGGGTVTPDVRTTANPK